jgi:cell division inhibitor SulA
MFQTRVIKIQPEYRKNKFTRKLTPVPSLKLSGNWLEAAGFHTGKIIHVHVENNVLVVQTVEPNL